MYIYIISTRLICYFSTPISLEKKSILYQQKSDCIYHFPNDLELNRIPFGAEPIGRVCK